MRPASTYTFETCPGLFEEIAKNSSEIITETARNVIIKELPELFGIIRAADNRRKVQGAAWVEVLTPTAVDVTAVDTKEQGLQKLVATIFRQECDRLRTLMVGSVPDEEFAAEMALSANLHRTVDNYMLPLNERKPVKVTFDEPETRKMAQTATRASSLKWAAERGKRKTEKTRARSARVELVKSTEGEHLEKRHENEWSQIQVAGCQLTLTSC